MKGRTRSEDVYKTLKNYAVESKMPPQKVVVFTTDRGTWKGRL